MPGPTKPRSSPRRAGQPRSRPRRSRRGTRARPSCPLNPAAPAAELERLLAHLRPTHRPGRRRPARPSRTASRRRPAPRPIVVTSGPTGDTEGRRAHARGHGGHGPRLLGRARRRDPATAGSRACRCTTSPASACWRARTSPACRARCTTRFDLDRVARAPRAEGATIVSLVPTALRRLLDAGAPLHEYRRVIVGGAPCPPALRARAEAARRPGRRRVRH